MVVLYFCLEGHAPIVRTWLAVPRIGETISLPELGGNLNPFKVHDLIWEGNQDAPSVIVYLRPTHADQFTSATAISIN